MDLTTLFKNIADAIREKDGTTDEIPAEDFPERIQALGKNTLLSRFSPHMTGYTAPAPYVVTESGNLSSHNRYGWYAFDGVNGYEWWSNNASNPGPWLAFDFGKDTYVAGIGMYPRTNYANQLPSSFVIQGSKDGTTWTDIKRYENLPTPPQGAYRDHIFDNTVYYRFYRIYDMVSNYPYGTGNCAIEDIVFYLPIN